MGPRKEKKKNNPQNSRHNIPAAMPKGRSRTSLGKNVRHFLKPNQNTENVRCCRSCVNIKESDLVFSKTELFKQIVD